ncbi:MAG: hypothetical protein COW19_08085 [Zetaproteobacteria bacterium CG12_big_fil_rev_8_21_14_0_65_55_1124]|nr:MAG: hypothetical protein AUJ58_03950 [Zetaproteobacteria bacterium CG1_02_55_237]PIS20352.1 MAG: hypothetical protein COT53_01085 [Zetaproteobacteria bacterium CG08_land_8_20_14_0_20_55_17]PIW42423.1 MAG: hypothetical protein COW19_08085 [Zetaproteobacteria bacterium CG12_big_fil_rev_8_21_14_0_65_55_1124]PIY52354.1 MAG: hypothetical protein COZ01_08125 [Zetaproteobacteria bacterium CG_4_10_14_0_8_um_filter_55_43]PIZ37133.1 MAG: hypothetical protein COY36_10225 [Zetaproteobacteria bacterium 
MVTQQRIESLKTYCQRWRDRINDAEESKTELLSLSGIWITNDIDQLQEENENQLSNFIEEIDGTIRSYNKILNAMESLLDRAIAGEDV